MRSHAPHINRSIRVMILKKKLKEADFFQGGDVGYILYNDQPPKQRASRTCGHTKGAVNCLKTNAKHLKYTF